MNGLNRNRCRHAVEIGQDFKTSIEKQFQRGFALVQFTQETGEGDTLRFTRGFGQQLKTVERIEEQAAIALSLKVLGSAEQMFAPGGCRQVHDLTVPRVIAHRADGLIQTGLLNFSLGTAEFAHGQVSEWLAA